MRQYLPVAPLLPLSRSRENSEGGDGGWETTLSTRGKRLHFFAHGLERTGTGAGVRSAGADVGRFAAIADTRARHRSLFIIKDGKKRCGEIRATGRE